jgi:hypothetical protein
MARCRTRPAVPHALRTSGRSGCAPERGGSGAVNHGMGEYGPATVLVERLIEHAEHLTEEEAADLFRARAIRMLSHSPAEERRAHAVAARAAAVAGRETEFRAAAQAAAAAWGRARHVSASVRLTVGVAVANAAGALVVEDYLPADAFEVLFGPWQQAIGRLIPVGPGYAFADRGPVHGSRRAGHG